MNCYYCGCRLSEHDFCTGCGADVSVYKKIMYASNHYYNDGLEKASVRDLTGAVHSLRQSLKFNKNNIEARNLLGLVYFEMGDVAPALSEWVISKNLRPNKNIADDYINMIQANASRLESINQTNKKYNQALAYCHQDSLDLAIIQLKKVLSMNPRFVKAHQLLALLYINSEEWEKARKELRRCYQIDRSNTITLRYLKEVETVLEAEETSKPGGKKRNISEDSVKYQSGNETIIQPVGGKEKNGIAALLQIGLGIAIGIAAVWFLILPSRVQAERNKVNEELRKVSEQSDSKSATIDDLNHQVSSLTAQVETMQAQMDSYEGVDGTLSIMDKMIQAIQAYMTDPEDAVTIEGYLDAITQEVQIEETSESFQAMYEQLSAEIGPKLADQYYDIGYEDYMAERFAEAIPSLEKVVQYADVIRYDEDSGYALYYLGNCYKEVGESEKAKEVYRKVITDIPGTERARKSQQFLTELEAAD